MDLFEISIYAKPIKGFEDYFITTYGDLELNGKKIPVKTLNRAKKRKKLLFTCMLKNKKGEEMQHYIHELVAEHLVPNPENKKFIVHKNGDIYDNSAENLAWVTLEEKTEIAEKESWKEAFGIISSSMFLSSKNKSA